MIEKLKRHLMFLWIILSSMILAGPHNCILEQQINCIGLGKTVHFWYKTIEYDGGGTCKFVMISAADEQYEILPPAAAWTEKNIGWNPAVTGSPITIQFTGEVVPFSDTAQEIYVDDVYFI